MKKLGSDEVPTASSKGCQNDGQPVPLSYLVAEANKGVPQPAQTKVPGRFSLLSGLVPARSVLCLRNTWYCSGSSCCFHSASVLWTGKVSVSVFVLMMDSDVAMIGRYTRVRNSAAATD